MSEAASHAVPGSAPPGLRGKRVLVVEDSFLVGMAMCRMLEQLGCVAIGPVSRAAEAEALARGTEYHAAVMDLGLGGGTSLEVARAARARGKPVVFVTGYSSNELVPPELRGLPRLLKPVEPGALAAALTRLIGPGDH